MRDKRKAKQCEFIVIGGFSLGQAGFIAPSIALMRGNGYGEEQVKKLQTFPVGTRYREVSDAAKKMSEEKGIVLGRNFPNDDWYGPEA